MFEENQDPISSLVHLYVDGAFSRRELIRRVAKHTGSIATAAATVSAMGVAEAQQIAACPADLRVPEDASDIAARSVEYPGDAGTMFGYLAEPRNAQGPQPGVIVVHENRGLVDHIKDVARRVARAGFVALAPDLLSRQGGTGLFTDPTAQAQAYNRTLPQERLADLFCTMTFLKTQPSVNWQRLGAVGFCAGGGNCWNLALGAPDLNAVVIYYGTPVPAVDQLDAIRAPVLAHYAELDRNLSNNLLPIASSLLTRQKSFGLNIWQGAGHAFNNDTSPAFEPTVACEAWARSIAWFNKFLRA
jgi:carboxymethylenebutenolidase